jgi:cytochrome o ubiquinol oxidase subunit 2
MSRKYKIAVPLLLLAGLGTGAYFYLKDKNLTVLNPKGTIAAEQRELLVITTLLMLIVVIPVFVMMFYFVWKYREGNTKAKYSPEWDHSHIFETIWWGLPMAIIGILAVITWQSSHKLDPYRPLESDVKPLKVQVVAMNWKWLFIYPEQDTASLNYLRIPEDTPINFEITADAPMNSFWIPSLGGQVYAMAGMSTKLHLLASERGVFEGSSANLSGQGFAGMRFKAESVSGEEFSNWIRTAQESGSPLTKSAYEELAKPSSYVRPAVYWLREPDLYDKVVMKYMMPDGGENHGHEGDTGHDAHAH